MNNFNLTDVVKNLLIINVLVYITFLTVFKSSYELFGLWYIENEHFKTYQIVTHFFMHDNHSFFHIVFNMYALATFGPMIEMVWKAKRFLFFYLFCGLGAAFFSLAVDYVQVHYYGYEQPISMMVGASGAIYGLLTAFALMYPRAKIGMLFIPIMIEARYAILLFAGLEIFQGVGNFGTGVAHFAHLGGMISGAGLIYYWRFFGSRL
jgi:membrane associated rhomboid family serine protease